MKIHLMAPVDGNKSDYKKIIDTVESLGHEMITKHVLDRKIDEVEKETPQEAALFAKKIQQWIKSADVVIFEVSRADVSIGYEVATALHYSKPVIVLYREGTVVPHGFKGINSDKLQVDSYDDETLPELLKVAINYAQETTDIRFNFFLPPHLMSYLDWIAKNQKLPRSVYLRELIERDKEKNKEYNDEFQTV